MAPNKGKARSQPPPQPSDYETDAPPPAVDVPLPPPRSNEELNFSVLKRTYPDLLALEHVTSYVALYTFNLETQQWEKVGIEGTLFICQMAPSSTGVEQYCVVILNRRGLDNFYIELTSRETMEISDPYVILQGDLIYGLWIFADPPPASTHNDRVETAAKMLEIADRAQVSREAAEKGVANGVEGSHEEVDAASAPMGRQLSLRQLFGQQHSQNGHQMPDVYRHQQAYTPTPDSRPAQQDVLASMEPTSTLEQAQIETESPGKTGKEATKISGIRDELSDYEVYFTAGSNHSEAEYLSSSDTDDSLAYFSTSSGR